MREGVRLYVPFRRPQIWKKPELFVVVDLDPVETMTPGRPLPLSRIVPDTQYVGAAATAVVVTAVLFVMTGSCCSAATPATFVTVPTADGTTATFTVVEPPNEPRAQTTVLPQASTEHRASLAPAWNVVPGGSMSVSVTFVAPEPLAYDTVCEYVSGFPTVGLAGEVLV